MYTARTGMFDAEDDELAKRENLDGETRASCKGTLKAESLLIVIPSMTNDDCLFVSRGLTPNLVQFYGRLFG